MDTKVSQLLNKVACSIEAGAELVRITAPSKRKLRIYKTIRRITKTYTTPLVADIHFTPNAAEIAAARIVESVRVRVNLGNYVDKKKIELIEYSDAGLPGRD